MGTDYSCKSCGYLWTSRKAIGTPSVCPNCRSRDFDFYNPAPPIHTNNFESFSRVYKTIKPLNTQPNLISLYGSPDDFRRCPRCNQTVAVDDTVCVRCSHVIALPWTEVGRTTDEQLPPKEPIKCHRCNHIASDKDILCNKCGYFLAPSF